MEKLECQTLLVEAKAWETPFIVRLDPGTRFEGSKRDLLLAAIRHIMDDAEQGNNRLPADSGMTLSSKFAVTSTTSRNGAWT